MPDETTARDVAVVVVPVIREPEKMTVVKRVAGVHSIYRSADGCKPVARLSAARAGEKPHRCINPGAFPGGDACASVRATGPQTTVNP